MRRPPHRTLLDYINETNDVRAVRQLTPDQATSASGGAPRDLVTISVSRHDDLVMATNIVTTTAKPNSIRETRRAQGQAIKFLTEALEAANARISTLEANARKCEASLSAGRADEDAPALSSDRYDVLAHNLRRFMAHFNMPYDEEVPPNRRTGLGSKRDRDESVE